MGSSFQMPEFNFRLRRALDPFASEGRKFGGVSFWNPQQEEDTQEELPPFSSAMPDYSQFYDDSGPAQERYKSYLDKVPQPNDYAPTKWRRLGAVLSGVSDALGGRNGYETARNIVRDPYETAYQDWARGGQGLKEAATMEEASAAKKATTYQKILSDYIEQQRWNADREIKQGTLDNARARTEIENKKAQIDADYKAGLISAAEARQRTYAAIAENTRKYQQGSLGIQQGRLEEDRRQGLDRAATNWYNAVTGRQRADSYGNYMNRPSYSSAGDMQRFEMDATREYLALNPEVADIVEVDDYGRIDYNSIDDPTMRAKIIADIQRGIKAKQGASMRPGR